MHLIWADGPFDADLLEERICVFLMAILIKEFYLIIRELFWISVCDLGLESDQTSNLWPWEYLIEEDKSRIIYLGYWDKKISWFSSEHYLTLIELTYTKLWSSGPRELYDEVFVWGQCYHPLQFEPKEL